MTDPRIIVALDFSAPREALELCGKLDPASCRLKVGSELFTVAGPGMVETLMKKGFQVFLDLKFHDIPNTVAGACKAAASLGVWMVNVHALGGKAMLTAAREALAEGRSAPKLVAVTLLTSMGDDDLAEIGIAGEPEEMVLRLASLTHACGLDGVVCSAREARELKTRFGAGFCLVTPGIRPAASAAGDQVRVTTPRRAIENGADYLVVGRPITRAANPSKVLNEIQEECVKALEKHGG